MVDFPCVHALDGRLRVKLAQVKGNSLEAREIEARLRACEGIERVTANHVTGSVLIHYNSRRVRHEGVLLLLRSFGCASRSVHARANRPAADWARRLEDVVSDTLVRSTMEFAVGRVIRSLI